MTELLFLTFVFAFFSCISLRFVSIAHCVILFYLLITFLKELAKPFNDLLNTSIFQNYKAALSELDSVIWASMLWTSLL